MSFTVIKHETPKFYLSVGDRESAVKVIERYYITSNAEAEVDQILMESSLKSAKIGLKQAFCTDRRFTQGSWIAVALAFLTYAQGYFALNEYGN